MIVESYGSADGGGYAMYVRGVLIKLGDGSGRGSGRGYGCGTGSGKGKGYGDGKGSGSGWGYCMGDYMNENKSNLK